jgi:hypothetical protein
VFLSQTELGIEEFQYTPLPKFMVSKGGRSTDAKNLQASLASLASLSNVAGPFPFHNLNASFRPLDP